MKSTLVTLITTATIFLWTAQHISILAIQYNGEYDIGAKDMAYLCKLIDEYKRTGVKPVVADTTPNMPRNTYLNSKTQCWKFQWNACNSNELGKTRPCGWYQMVRADTTECA